MSRAYRIQLSDSRTEVVHLEDRITTKLEMLEILPKEEMAELVARELVAGGYTRKGNVLSKREGSVEITIDLESGTITALLGDEASVSAEATETRNTANPDDPSEKEKLADQVKRSLDRKLEEETRKMSDAISARLERGLKDAKETIDQAVSRATVSALKTKAGRLGEIETIEEGADGSVTIKVRI